MGSYTLRTEGFEGPLDLLLALIEKRKLLINDVSLAEVTDDYLHYLERHPEFPVAETAQFVLVGSALLLIKSRSLLPVLTLSEEERCSIEDLEARLKLLERYRTCVADLEKCREGGRLYRRTRTRAQELVFTPFQTLTAQGMYDAMCAAVRELPIHAPKLSETIVRKVVSLEDMMERLVGRINECVQVSFRDFAGGGSASKEKVTVIVSFLAMLELIRRGVVRVEQETRFGDITMRTDTVQVPRYG